MPGDHDDAKLLTEVRHGAAAAVAVWAGLPLVGAVAGYFLPRLLTWVAGLGWAPFQGPVRFLADLPQPWLGVGAVVAGALGGLLLAATLHDEALSVTVTGGQVVLRRGRTEVVLDRTEVAEAWTEDDHLVLLSADGRELARQPSMLPAGRLQAALESTGVRWHRADPYADAYRRWVPGTPGLPAGADALLTARAKAIGRGDGGDGEELRAELARLGVVVRDRERRQHVRTTPPAP